MKKLVLFLTLVLSISASAQLKVPRILMFNSESGHKMSQAEIFAAIKNNTVHFQCSTNNA